MVTTRKAVRGRVGPPARGMRVAQAQKKKTRHNAVDYRIPAPAHLVAKPTVAKSKHHTYFEFADNSDKKKKLEFEVTDKKTPSANFTFVPIGNPELTHACKELSREEGALIYIVSGRKEENAKIGEHVHRVGYHFRSTIVERAAASIGALQYFDGESIPRYTIGASPDAIPDNQDDINKQADAAIRDLFPRIPNTDREMIVRHAFQKGAIFKGKPVVGLQQDLSLSRRVQLAVIAHIRHQHTRYDDLLRETTYENARRTVESLCLDILVKWRGDEETGRDQLDEVLREIVVISDSEDSDDDNVEGDDEDSSADEVEEVSPVAELPMHVVQQTSGLRHVPSLPAAPRRRPPAFMTTESERDGVVAMRTRLKNMSKHAKRRDRRERKGFRRYQAYKEALNRQRKPKDHDAPAEPNQPSSAGIVQAGLSGFQRTLRVYNDEMMEEASDPPPKDPVSPRLRYNSPSKRPMRLRANDDQRDAKNESNGKSYQDSLGRRAWPARQHHQEGSVLRGHQPPQPQGHKMLGRSRTAAHIPQDLPLPSIEPVIDIADHHSPAAFRRRMMEFPESREVKYDSAQAQKPHRPGPAHNGPIYIEDSPPERHLAVDKYSRHRPVPTDVYYRPEPYPKYDGAPALAPVPGPGYEDSALNRHPLFAMEQAPLPNRRVRRVVVVRTIPDQPYPVLGGIRPQDGPHEPFDKGHRVREEAPSYGRPDVQPFYREPVRVLEQTRRPLERGQPGTRIVEYPTPLGYQERVVPDSFPSQSSSYGPPRFQGQSFQPPPHSASVTYPSLPDFHVHEQRGGYDGSHQSFAPSSQVSHAGTTGHIRGRPSNHSAGLGSDNEYSPRPNSGPDGRQYHEVVTRPYPPPNSRGFTREDGIVIFDN